MQNNNNGNSRSDFNEKLDEDYKTELMSYIDKLKITPIDEKNQLHCNFKTICKNKEELQNLLIWLLANNKIRIVKKEQFEQSLCLIKLEDCDRKVAFAMNVY